MKPSFVQSGVFGKPALCLLYVQYEALGLPSIAAALLLNRRAAQDLGEVIFCNSICDTTLCSHAMEDLG